MSSTNTNDTAYNRLVQRIDKRILAMRKASNRLKKRLISDKRLEEKIKSLTNVRDRIAGKVNDDKRE